MFVEIKYQYQKIVLNKIYRIKDTGGLYWKKRGRKGLTDIIQKFQLPEKTPEIQERIEEIFLET